MVAPYDEIHRIILANLKILKYHNIMFSSQNSLSQDTLESGNEADRYFTAKELKLSFLIINLMIISIIFFTCISERRSLPFSCIRQGTLKNNITNLAFLKGQDFAPLNGEWDFAWYPEIPENIDKEIIPDKFTQSEYVPGYWKSGSTGLGIYRLKIDPWKDMKIPALKITNVMDAYKLFINRKEVYSVGNISSDPDEYSDESRPAVIPLYECNDEVEICIIVGNMTEKRGGLNRTVYFGEYENLKNYREKKLVFNSILQGISLTVIFYNILFLFMNRKRGGTNNLFLIILCFTIICYCGLKQEMMLKTVFTGLTGEIRAKLIYLSFLLPFPVFACYIKSIYSKIFGIKSYSLIILFSGMMAGFVLLFKSSIFSKYLLYLEAANLLLALFLAGRLLYLYIKTKDTTPLTQLIGMYIFIAGFIAAVLDDNLAIPSNAPFILLTGFVVYLTAGNTILSIRAFNRLKLLHKALITSERDKENLRKLSYIDSLTEISNRRHFEEFIRLHWEKIDFIGETTALFMIDIDNFKIFNDTYGHQEGDVCLRKTAAAINMELNRENDIIFRYGGEEFVVITSNISIEGCLKIAEKLRTNVEKLNIRNDNSPHGEFVTISVGISYYNPAKEQKNWERTLGEADSALYKAKKRKNCCVLHEYESAKSGDKI